MRRKQFFQKPAATLWAILVVCLAGILIINGCRKMDKIERPEPKTSTNNMKERFFNEHKATDPLVQAVSGYFQGLPDTQFVVSKIVSRIGYPRWDKAMVISVPNSGTAGRGNSGDSVSISYIPFVRDSQQFVNSSLLVKTSGEDTVFKYLCDWEYTQFGFGQSTDTSWNAKGVFHLFATLDRNVFNRKSFLLKDNRLFMDSGSANSMIVTLRPFLQTGNKNSDYTYVTTCELIDYCFATPEQYQQNCDGVCTSGCQYYSYTEEECTTFGIYTPDGNTSGGGGGSGSGGSGSGGGGNPGGTPPECIPGSGKALNVSPCEPGWEPIPDEPSLPSEPIDSMLSRFYASIKPRTDSLFAKSLNSNWEYSMILVQNGTSIYLKNEKTNQDSLSTEVNFTLAPGEILLGYLHCHPSTSSNVNERSAPSGSDVHFLRQKLYKNFVQFTECGNATYALVIEDPIKAKTFLDSKRQSSLNDVLTNSAMQEPNWFTNWQNATQMSLSNFIGTASLNGIGLYKSIDLMRENWSKINP